jgi:hypothetical protein
MVGGDADFNQQPEPDDALVVPQVEPGYPQI